MRTMARLNFRKSKNFGRAARGRPEFRARTKKNRRVRENRSDIVHRADEFPETAG